MEYDLAHEGSEASRAGRPTASRRAEAVKVATQTDYDGDYGYDLAHDVPRD